MKRDKEVFIFIAMYAATEALIRQKIFYSGTPTLK